MTPRVIVETKSDYFFFAFEAEALFLAGALRAVVEVDLRATVFLFGRATVLRAVDFFFVAVDFFAVVRFFVVAIIFLLGFGC